MCGFMACEFEDVGVFFIPSILVGDFEAIFGGAGGGQGSGSGGGCLRWLMIIYDPKALVEQLMEDETEEEDDCTLHTAICSSFVLAVLLRYPVANVQAVVCFLVRVDATFNHWRRHHARLCCNGATAFDER
jgi:hypothetical protein